MAGRDERVCFVDCWNNCTYNELRTYSWERICIRSGNSYVTGEEGGEGGRVRGGGRGGGRIRIRIKSKNKSRLSTHGIMIEGEKSSLA